MPKTDKSKRPVVEAPRLEESDSSSSSDSDGPGTYHVEVITSARVVRKRRNKRPAMGWEYFVKWWGYDSDSNSWEPEENVEGCQRLLRSFWGHIGMDNDNYDEGTVLKASEQWIQQEKDFFAKQYKERVEKKRKDKQERREKKEDKTVASKQDDVSSEEESRLLIKIPPKRKRVETSSSEDEPLSKHVQNMRPSKVVKVAEPQHRSRSLSNLFSEEETSPPPLAPPAPTPVPATANSIVKPTYKYSRSIKIANFPQLSNPNFQVGGNSTKKRLAQKALAPTAPKDIAKDKSKARPLPARTGSTSASLGGLHFKKKVQPGRLDDVQSPVTNEPTLASLNSPVRIVTDNASISSQADIPLPRANQFIPSYPPENQRNFFDIEAERFLGSIMPSELAGPIVPAKEVVTEAMPPKPVAPRLVVPPIPRIQKTWKWTGPLYLEKTRLADVVLTPISSNVDEHAMRFSILFQAVESIQVTKLYDMLDMYTNLNAYKRPGLFGLLKAEKESDSQSHQSFLKLISWMDKKQQLFLIPSTLDNNVIGHTAFFAYSNDSPLIPKFKHEIFEEDKKGALVAVFLPFVLNPQDVQKNGRLSVQTFTDTQVSVFKEIRCRKFEPFDKKEREEWRDLQYRPHVHRAAYVLGFPRKLYSDITSFPDRRAWCLWSRSLPNQEKDFETKCLLQLLESTKARRVDAGSDARLVFIHVNALSNIFQFPGLARRRLSLHTRFYLYGTHPKVPYKAWAHRVREVFAMGGIMTFTASVILADPLGVVNLIAKAYAHPFWCSYILPSALGVLAKLECRNEDPFAMLEQGKLLTSTILKEIELGSTSLIQAPPKVTDSRFAEVQLKWEEEYFSFEPPTQREALERGIRAFLDNPKLFKADGAELVSESRRGIEKDMYQMQQQPSLMEYRRFVLIDTDESIVKRAQTPDGCYTDGFERTTVSKFDFKDQFFPHN